MVKINLLSARRKRVVERQERVGKYTKYALFGAGGVSVIAVVLLVISFVVGGQKTKIEQELAQSKNKLMQYEDVAIESIKLGKRIKSIGEIVSGREGLEEKIDIYDRVYKGVVAMRSISFGGESSSNTLEIEAGVDSLNEFEQAQNELVSLPDDYAINEIFLNNISYGYLGDMSLNILMVLGSE